MAQIKVEAHGQYGVLDVGEQFFGLHVAATVPGSPQMVLDVPDAISPETAIQQLLDANVIVDGRPVHSDYAPLGWIVKGPAPFAAPGDTFPLVMAAGCPERGHWGARPTRLGILDTGLDGGHIAFDGKDVQGDRTDGHGHGTHVASTAASAWGIASDSAIFMRNVLPNGNGSEAGVANGFRELADAGCDVISASLGGSPSQVIDAAVQYARQRGALVVCAAGNGGDAQPAGSPARAATISVYAVDRSEHPATFTDGKGWATTGSQGVDITAAARGTRSGAMTMSGTSMACPHISGLLCLLRGAGLSPQACLDYLAGHRATVAGCTNGVLKLAADFGAAEGGAVDIDAIKEKTEAIRDLVAVAQAHRCEYDATKKQYQASMAQIMDQDVGPIVDVANIIDELLSPKVDPGPVDPPAPEPAVLLGVCGSYPGHDPARDVYLGWTEEQVQWGPHHAFEIIAPKAGSVQALAFPTPLSVWQAMDADWRKELERFFADFVCWLPKAGDVVVTDTHVDPLQTMHVHAYTPDGGFPTRGGTIRLQVGAHVRQDIRVGRVAAQGVIAVVWDSGIRWEPSLNTRAAHYHSAPSQSGQLLPNGDMDGIYGCEMFGWQVQNIGRLPGPNDYQTGRYCAGRLLSDFTSAGKPLPPMPQ